MVSCLISSSHNLGADVEYLAGGGSSGKREDGSSVERNSLEARAAFP